jgi:hypothetical protein
MRNKPNQTQNGNKKSRHLAGFLKSNIWIPVFTGMTNSPLVFVFVLVLFHLARPGYARNMPFDLAQGRPFDLARGKLVSGVGFIVGLFEFLGGQMGVNLSGRERLMAEQLLNAPQIGAVI